MEKTSFSNGIVPELLKKDNYEKWSIFMRHYFEAQDLWEVVNPSEDRSSSLGNGNTKEWSKKNALALHAIKISCGDKMFDMIKGMNSAKDVWNTLANQVPSHTVSLRRLEPGLLLGEPDENEWSRSLRDTIISNNSVAVDDFFDNHLDVNPPTALHFAFTVDPTSTNRAFTDELIKRINKIERLMRKDKSGNTLLAIAVRYEEVRVIRSLINKNKKLLGQEIGSDQNLLTTAVDAEGKIPVQLACERGNEEITRLLYLETPLNFLHGDYGFQLLQGCISKKMFDIALHLLHHCPEYLKFHIAREDLTPVIPMLAQFSESPFSSESRLGFWRRWIFHCIQLKIIFIKQNNGPNNDQTSGGSQHGKRIGFVVYIVIFGIRVQVDSIRCVEMIINQQEEAASIGTEIDRPGEPSHGNDQEGGQSNEGWRSIKCKFGNICLCIALPLVFPPLWFIVFIKMVLGKLLQQLYSMILNLLGLNQLLNLRLKHAYANEVLNLVSERLKELGPDDLVRYGAVEATFLAIKNGIPEVAIEFTKKNKKMLWGCTDPEDPTKNIFAWTVAHRQEKVAYFLHKFAIGNTTFVVDEDGNNILHLAAKLAPQFQLSRVSGAALQLQSEMRWLQAVEDIVPSFYKECRNKNCETPFELFVREHKDLIKEAEEWMKKTAESSTVVGALIITIMFAAAFTVPGGNNQENGHPIFANEVSFMIFLISDAVSLFFACTSVLIFLGIHTGRYAVDNLTMVSITKKLIIGFSMLFISIGTMMVSFSATLFLMLERKLWAVIPIMVLATIPVTVFGFIQYPLIVEIFYLKSRIFNRATTNFFRELWNYRLVIIGAYKSWWTILQKCLREGIGEIE